MRDLRRIHLAQRLMRLEARTTTICAWTGLNEERVRNLGLPPSGLLLSNACRVLAPLVCASFLLIACSREPSETVRTISYFQEHADERATMLAHCASDPRRRGATPNCVNAGQAQAKEEIGSFRRLPPSGSTRGSHVDVDDPDRPQVRPY